MTPRRADGCDQNCAANCAGGFKLQRMGVRTNDCDRVVALAGNPNTGKSTLFNCLTGLKQHTGNWPGKTVARAEGAFVHGELRYKLVDLPGTYSLLSASTDEEVARDFILFGQPDCVIVVVDATSLERNLNLVFQVMEITARTVVCVNLMDEASRKGIAVDIDGLSRRLGVPAVATSARTRHGVAQLIDVVAGVADGSVVAEPRLPPTPDALKDAVDRVVPLIESLVPGLPNARWIAYRLVEGDHHIRRALENGELAALAQSQVTDRAADSSAATSRGAASAGERS